MRAMRALLERRQFDAAEVRRPISLTPTLLERERWHALWLLSRDWNRGGDGRGAGGGAHTIGQWAAAFGQGDPEGLALSKLGVPALDVDVEHQAQLKAAVQEAPGQVGIDLSNRNWKAVHRFVQNALGRH